jgi:hypothetical protein
VRVLQRRTWDFGEDIIAKQLTRTPEQPVVVAPGPVEPADADVRTFADIENGDPDSLFDEISLDAAII